MLRNKHMTKKKVKHSVDHKELGESFLPNTKLRVERTTGAWTHMDAVKLTSEFSGEFFRLKPSTDLWFMWAEIRRRAVTAETINTDLAVYGAGVVTGFFLGGVLLWLI